MPGGPGGGPGGLGGFAGMLMRGVAGGRGPGGPGGMGMNGPGGGGQNTGSASVSDVYDVDRWKRADNLDSGFEPTMVQTVRDAWERETEEKKMNSPAARIRSLFHRKGRGESRRSMLRRERRMERRARGSRSRQDDYEKDRSYEDAGRKRESGRENGQGEDRSNRVRASSGAERPRGTLEGNTIITPGMKKASHHIPDVFPDEGSRVCNTGDYTYKPYRRAVERSPIGLATRAGIDSFFSSSPLNSTLLAVDSLSAGPLTLNQVRQHEVAVSTSGGFLLPEQAVSGSDAVREHHPLSAGAGQPAETVTTHGTYRPVASGHAGGGEGSSSFRTGVVAGASNRNGNVITEHTGASYMDALREHREQRKYDVHVRNH